MKTDLNLSDILLEQQFDDIAAILKKSKNHQDSSLTGKYLCPSVTIIEKSVHLFGVLTKNLEIHYLKDPIPLNDELKKAFKKLNDHEGYFRFTAKCRKCAQWKDNRCSVAYFSNKIADLTETVPDCSIRKNCRWFMQEGETVCCSCKFAVR